MPKSFGDFGSTRYPDGAPLMGGQNEVRGVILLMEESSL